MLPNVLLVAVEGDCINWDSEWVTLSYRHNWQYWVILIQPFQQWYARYPNKACNVGNFYYLYSFARCKTWVTRSKRCTEQRSGSYPSDWKKWWMTASAHRALKTTPRCRPLSPRRRQSKKCCPTSVSTCSSFASTRRPQWVAKFSAVIMCVAVSWW